MNRQLGTIQRVRKWLISQARRSAIEEEWFDLAGFLLSEYERAVIAGLAHASTPELPPPRPPRKAKTREEEILRRDAEGGIEALVFTWRSDGSADIQIDGGTQIHLKPGLAELLDVISVDDSTEDLSRSTTDGLVGWKRYDDVGACLSRRKGGLPVGRRAVTQRIWKLREVLRESGINPFLVLTSRRKGVRFALRRHMVGGDER